MTDWDLAVQMARETVLTVDDALTIVSLGKVKQMPQEQVREMVRMFAAMTVDGPRLRRTIVAAMGMLVQGKEHDQ